MSKFPTSRGMTLVEMLVAISIVILVLAGLSVFFVRFWRTNSFIIEEGQASFAASRAINETVSNLRKVKQSDRGDYPVNSADDFDLVVFSDIDGDGVTEKVHYFLDLGNDEFRMGVSKPSGSPLVYTAGDDSVIVLARYVVNDASQPVFDYCNEDYPGDTVNNPLSTPVANKSEIRMVRIHLWINIKPLTAPDNINIESYVNLRNLNDYI